MKRTISGILLLVVLLFPLFSARADGSVGSSNYLYDEFEHSVPSIPAYVHTASYMANSFPEIETLKNMTDAYVTNDRIYLLCQTQLIVFDHDFNVLFVTEGYVGADGREVKFDSGTGIFVTTEGDYYICEATRGRILHFNSDHSLRRVLDAPGITGIDPTVKYRPTKLVVDDAGRIFVISKGMYEGIVQLNPDGTFASFYGVNEVKFSLWSLLWRNISTSSQRDKQSLWLPTDFTNLCIDPDGFIFATVQSSSAAKSVMRLNAKGENILRVDDDASYPSGDMWFMDSTTTGAPVGPSEFTSVDVNHYGVYICLDTTRSRVFAYNEDGKLLFVFGGPGNREGYFRGPVDADFIDDSIMVLDSTAESIEIFTVTRYGSALMRAVQAQYDFDYLTAEGYWREALSYNQNLFIAYSGIGRSLLRRGEHAKALEYLELGGDRKYYSKALEKVRNENLEQSLIPVVLTFIGLIVAWKIGKACLRRLRKKRGVAASQREDSV